MADFIAGCVMCSAALVWLLAGCIAVVRRGQTR